MTIPASSTPPRGPKANRAMARQLGFRGANALYVLAPNNDPFAKGKPAEVRDAEWFADVWDRFGTEGTHIRRLHYRVLSEHVTRPDGSPYLNTTTCRTFMNNASAAARILGLVDAEAFADRSTAPTHLYREQRNGGSVEPGITFDPPDWWVPTFDTSRLSEIRLLLPEPHVAGYGYHHDDQPVLIEVWAEKSTMRDVLDPLCQAEHVNYREGKGFESITHAIELIRRAERHGRPAHVLYVSDFDPAGDAMPVSVARQLQFWTEILGASERFTLHPVVLTHEQVAAYRLPRQPVEDPRMLRFEERYGEGAVELDALEGLYPGELANIVRQAIRDLEDATLRRRLDAARDEATRRVADVWGEAAAPLREEADRLTAEGRDALADSAQEIADLIAEHLNQLGPFEERADELVRQAERLAAELDIELPERPEAIEPEVDDEVLFDSERHWLDQLDVFRRRRNGSTP
jgi:hypothetical protein